GSGGHLYTLGIISDDLTEGTDTQTLYAFWVADDEHFIRYREADEVTPVDGKMPSLYKKGIGIAVLGSPEEKHGYTFAGWFTDKDLTSEVGNPAISASDESEKTFYAKFAPIESKVTFDSLDGTQVPEELTVKYGEAYNESTVDWPADPIKKGYEFAGWYLDNHYLKEITETGIVETTHDTKLVARWNANKTNTITVDNLHNLDKLEFTSEASTYETATDPGLKLVAFPGYNGPTTDQNVNILIKVDGNEIPDEDYIYQIDTDSIVFTDDALKKLNGNLTIEAINPITAIATNNIVTLNQSNLGSSKFEIKSENTTYKTCEDPAIELEAYEGYTLADDIVARDIIITVNPGQSGLLEKLIPGVDYTYDKVSGHITFSTDPNQGLARLTGAIFVIIP
ncbi:MAG: InlB B-repeat-containing protein, partial [Anaerovoracaceae bacterium]